MSVEVDETSKNTCVCIHDMYQQYIREHYDKVYSHGYEHIEIIEDAEAYCHRNSWRINDKVKDFVYDIPLIIGPRICILESVRIGSLTVGENYTIEIVVLDKITKETYGKLSLNHNICLTDMQIGEAELVIIDHPILSQNAITLVNQCVLSLRLSGAIRVNSTVDVIAQLEGEEV